ncbi:MAG: type I-F CRISPR-associated protein Csy1 [Alphaproteobacteria bacterium]|nr:type I-F CRISPR-associated protein Csy1 [Alphaproteobacteria bacterium]
MMDKAITTFFDERKVAWLKKNLKASMSDVEVKDKELECEAVFSLSTWLPNAAKRAGQISISTHPCTFSHPSSRKNKNGYVSSIIATNMQANDGFLRSGNVNVAADALGNAAALDVYKFLTLIMNDGKNLIEHLQQDSELALVLFTLPNVDDSQNYQALKEGFLAMTSAGSESITSSKIKQVYFPIENDGKSYHQLSILTASGILFDLRKRLDGMRFGDEIKEARAKRKANQEHQGYKEIYNLTTIGYGGTKPQNISVLNNQNGGKAHMFMCAPPKIKNRDVHFPTSDFFNQTVNYFQCREQFQQLHKLYSRDDNNMHIRADRDEDYQRIVDHIIEKMWQVRAVALEQYIDTTSSLSSAQTTWLCEQHQALRDSSDDWLDDIVSSITTFVFHGYEKTLKSKAIKFGEAEHKHMKKIVEANKEALR